MRTDALLGPSVDVVGPAIGSSDDRRRAQGPVLGDRDGHDAWAVDDRVGRRRGVVVGVTKIADVHEATEALMAVHAEGALVTVDLDGDEAVRDRDESACIPRGRRMTDRRGGEPAPSKARDV